MALREWLQANLLWISLFLALWAVALAGLSLHMASVDASANYELAVKVISGVTIGVAGLSAIGFSYLMWKGGWRLRVVNSSA